MSQEPEPELSPQEPDSTLEPYLQIVAPNLDKLSGDLLRPGTASNRRARRGLLILLATILAAAAIVAVTVLLS